MCYDYTQKKDKLRMSAKNAFRQWAKMQQIYAKAKILHAKISPLSNLSTSPSQANPLTENLLAQKPFDRDSKIICKYLFALLQKLQSKNILLYAPFVFEADIWELIWRLKKQKKKIFLPFIQDLSFKMLPLHLPLQKNRFGIFESKYSHFNLAKIDTAVIPTFGIDAKFKRVGFGKGMYDRFFSRNHKIGLYPRKKVCKIFVSRTPCISPRVLTQSFDIMGDYFISALSCCKRTKYDDCSVYSRRAPFRRYRCLRYLPSKQKGI